ncbi:MAG: ribosome silencing factor, partial [Casimicrobium sp.]
MRLNKIQQAAVTALEDIKATDIVVLDTRTLTSLYDAIIIATAESARQTKALARNVQDKVRAAGGYVRAIEGEESGEWVLVDCGELVAHVMLPATRSLYNLEELWTPAPTSKGAKTAKSPVKSSPKTAPIAQTSRAKTVDAVIDPAPIAKAKPASKSTSSATASKKKPASKT